MEVLLFFSLLIILPIATYSVAKFIGKKLTNSAYVGNYFNQSIISAVSILALVGLLYTLAHSVSYNNCALKWDAKHCYTYYDYLMFRLDISWYEYILIPSVPIIFIVELLIRTIIKKNNFIYSILNSVFLSLIALYIAYFIEHWTIGVL